MTEAYKSLLFLFSHKDTDSVRPHRRQPTRLPRPWDSPGKNTGVGCHCLLQCMKVKSETEFAQQCLTPSNPMDYSPPGSSVQGIFQARVLEWDAIVYTELLIVGFFFPALENNKCFNLYSFCLFFHFSATNTNGSSDKKMFLKQEKEKTVTFKWKGKNFLWFPVTKGKKNLYSFT